MRALESLWQDVQYGARGLASRPAFAATATLTLALGIGANTAVFSAVHAILLRPWPYRDAASLALVSETLPLGLDEVGVAAAEYLDNKAGCRVFSQVAAYEGDGFNLTGNGPPLRVDAARLTASAFPLLGVPPEIGRGLREEEEQRGSAGVVVLSRTRAAGGAGGAGGHPEGRVMSPIRDRDEGRFLAAARPPDSLTNQVLPAGARCSRASRSLPGAASQRS